MRWLLARGICSGKYAHGFVRGRSTATNAAVHNIKMPIANGGEFNEQEFLKIKGMLAYFADARPDLAPRYRADIAEIERLLEMRENKLAA